MPREGGASSTPRPVVSINGVSGILDRPPSRTMTLNINSHDFAFSRRGAPGVIQLRHPPSKIEGAGKTGCALHPRSRVQLRTENAHTSIQVQRKHSGLPCAMALRPYFVLPGERLCCHRHTQKLASAYLTPAPRRQDHTTSPYASGAFVLRASRVHHIPPRVRDDRDTPLLSRRDSP